MSTRNTRGTPCASASVAFLIVLMLGLTPLAHAADPDVPSDTADGWRKVVAYSQCAFAVYRAITPLDWAGAVFECARLFLSEPPDAGVA
jgi:hypothetical protein